MVNKPSHVQLIFYSGVAEFQGSHISPSQIIRPKADHELEILDEQKKPT